MSELLDTDRSLKTDVVAERGGRMRLRVPGSDGEHVVFDETRQAVQTPRSGHVADKARKGEIGRASIAALGHAGTSTPANSIVGSRRRRIAAAGRETKQEDNLYERNTMMRVRAEPGGMLLRDLAGYAVRKPHGKIHMPAKDVTGARLSSFLYNTEQPAYEAPLSPHQERQLKWEAEMKEQREQAMAQERAKDELRRQQARAEIAALTAASATVEEPRVVDAEDEEDEDEDEEEDERAASRADSPETAEDDGGPPIEFDRIDDWMQPTDQEMHTWAGDGEYVRRRQPRSDCRSLLEAVPRVAARKAGPRARRVVRAESATGPRRVASHIDNKWAPDAHADLFQRSSSRSRKPAPEPVKRSASTRSIGMARREASMLSLASRGTRASDVEDVGVSRVAGEHWDSGPGGRKSAAAAAVSFPDGAARRGRSSGTRGPAASAPSSGRKAHFLRRQSVSSADVAAQLGAGRPDSTAAHRKRRQSIFDTLGEGHIEHHEVKIPKFTYAPPKGVEALPVMPKLEMPIRHPPKVEHLPPGSRRSRKVCGITRTPRKLTK